MDIDMGMGMGMGIGIRRLRSDRLQALSWKVFGKAWRWVHKHYTSMNHFHRLVTKTFPCMLV